MLANQRRARTLARHLVSGRSMLLSTESTPVLFEEVGNVCRIRLNRPSKFNALNLEMVRKITPVYDALVAGTTKKTVVMTGEGGKAFCAGGDVASIRADSLAGGSESYDFFFEEYQLNHRIATAYEKHGMFQVAVWDGVTMGGGVGLSVHGKVRIATEFALFAMPETALGLFPDVGGTYALSRLNGGTPLGLYLGLTGARLGAADCIFSGLATHFLPREKVPAFVDTLVSMKEAATDYSTVDRLIKEMGAGTVPPKDGKIKPTLQPNMEGIEKCFKYESIEEIMAALSEYASNANSEEKKSWATATLKTLEKCSPMSLKVTLKAILLHADPKVSIGDALKNEYRIVQRMCEKDGDFFEGVRSILVDKDNNSKWKHANVKDISKDDVDAFFAPLSKDHPKGDLQLQA